MRRIIRRRLHKLRYFITHGWLVPTRGPYKAADRRWYQDFRYRLWHPMFWWVARAPVYRTMRDWLTGHG